MRRTLVSALIWLGLVAVLVSACGKPASNSDPAARAVESFLNALVSKDSNLLASFSCATWETNALMEMDSFQAVQARLDGLACQTSGTDTGVTQVKCQGKIVLTYNNENQELDLSVRTYHVVQEGGEYLVCGYQ
jgi:limonene-1,2-epoxide hydrolase